MRSAVETLTGIPTKQQRIFCGARELASETLVGSLLPPDGASEHLDLSLAKWTWPPLLALAWPGLTWYPWCMCLNLHFSYAVCLCNRLATNKPPGGANYNPHIAP